MSHYDNTNQRTKELIDIDTYGKIQNILYCYYHEEELTSWGAVDKIMEALEAQGMYIPNKQLDYLTEQEKGELAILLNKAARRASTANSPAGNDTKNNKEPKGLKPEMSGYKPTIESGKDDNGVVDYE